jgi:hypothetical protein
MFCRSGTAPLFTGLQGVSAAALAIAMTCSAAVAQTAAEIKPDAAKPALIVTPHAPVARQIEPMVAPVRRVAPGATIANAQKPVVTAAPAPAAVAAKTPASVPLAVSTPTVAKLKTPVVAAPAAVAVVAASTAASARPAPIKQPKFVAYTCKLGEDYSLERKTCFTPGVKAAGVGSKAEPVSKTAKLQPTKSALDTSGKSALGAKP